jgi:CheY-like chemotaxis protein
MVRLPLATDWAEVLVPPVWSATLLLIILVLAWALRRPLTRVFAALGVSRLSILGVDVEWLTNQAEDAYSARNLPAPGRGELRAFALLGVRLEPLIRDRRILWVDDNPANNETEAMLLRKLGVEVENATGTEEAVTRLRRDPARFDLVISDWTRGGNRDAGPELLTELGLAGIGLPVLMYVEDTSTERKARVAELGAKGITAEPDELLKQALVELATAG